MRPSESKDQIKYRGHFLLTASVQCEGDDQEAITKKSQVTKSLIETIAPITAPDVNEYWVSTTGISCAPLAEVDAWSDNAWQELKSQFPKDIVNVAYYCGVVDLEDPENWDASEASESGVWIDGYEADDGDFTIPWDEIEMSYEEIG